MNRVEYIHNRRVLLLLQVNVSEGIANNCNALLRDLIAHLVASGVVVDAIRRDAERPNCVTVIARCQSVADAQFFAAEATRISEGQLVGSSTVAPLAVPQSIGSVALFSDTLFSFGLDASLVVVAHSVASMQFFCDCKGRSEVRLQHSVDTDVVSESPQGAQLPLRHVQLLRFHTALDARKFLDDNQQRLAIEENRIVLAVLPWSSPVSGGDDHENPHRRKVQLVKSLRSGSVSAGALGRACKRARSPVDEAGAIEKQTEN